MNVQISKNNRARVRPEENNLSDELFYRFIVENLEDYGILAVDIHGIITSWNVGAKNLLGYSQKEIIGRPITILFLKEDILLNKPRQELEAIYLQGKLLIKQWQIHKNGTKIFVNSVMFPIKNAQGSVEGFVKVVRDFTKQKLLDEEHAHLEQLKNEFIGIASHELKTPITSIKTFTQVLNKRFVKLGDQKSAILLKKMDQQLIKLTILIRDMLDVTKISMGKLELHKEYFDYNMLISETVEEMQQTTLHIIKKTLEKTQIIFGDRYRIAQVLTNLLTNAIKYSLINTDIIVDTHTDKKEIITYVQDFGIGIPKGNQQKIFVQFSRVKAPTRNTFPGMGLGLYISKEIITRHHGKIWVESAKDAGSTFSFSLPL